MNKTEEKGQPHIKCGVTGSILSTLYNCFINTHNNPMIKALLLPLYCIIWRNDSIATKSMGRVASFSGQEAGLNSLKQSKYWELSIIYVGLISMQSDPCYSPLGCFCSGAYVGSPNVIWLELCTY